MLYPVIKFSFTGRDLQNDKEDMFYHVWALEDVQALERFYKNGIFQFQEAVETLKNEAKGYAERHWNATVALKSIEIILDF